MTLEIDRVRIARSGLEDPSLIGGQERGGARTRAQCPAQGRGRGRMGTVRTHIQGAGRIRQAAQLLTTAVNDAPAVTGTAQSAFITEGEYGPPRNAPDPAPMAVGIAYIFGSPGGRPGSSTATPGAPVAEI